MVEVERSEFDRTGVRAMPTVYRTGESLPEGRIVAGCPLRWDHDYRVRHANGWQFRCTGRRITVTFERDTAIPADAAIATGNKHHVLPPTTNDLLSRPKRRIEL